jgi:dipeptide/tripeptide permease
MSSDVGAVAGPLVAGYLADGYSFGAAFGVTAAVVAAGLVASLLSRETRHRPQADPEPETTAAPTPST